MGEQAATVTYRNASTAFTVKVKAIAADDADGDRELTATNITIISALIKGNGTAAKGADMNGDGAISSADYLWPRKR